LVFNKLICPALTSPHIYGLLEEPPNDVAARYLILLSKILQNLANGTLPGNKEQYMETMNNFITTNTPKLREFFDEISIPTSLDLTPQRREEILKALRDNALLHVWKHTKANLDKVLPNIMSIAPEGGTDLQDRLLSVIDTVNASLSKNASKS